MQDEKTLKGLVYSKSSNLQLSLNFPATFEEIENLALRVGSEPWDIQVEECKVLMDGIGGHFFLLKEAPLYMFNHLANLLTKLDFMERAGFDGGVSILEHRQPLTVADLVNLAMNIQQNHVTNCYPAANITELGAHFVNNQLITELENTSPQQFQWMVDHADYHAIGKELDKKLQGVFTPTGYVTLPAELEQLYDGKVPILERTPYQFKATFRFPGGGSASYVLPLEDDVFLDMEKRLEVGTELEVTTTLPAMQGVIANGVSLQSIQELAESLVDIVEYNDLPHYLALLSAVPNPTVRQAYELQNWLIDYNFTPGATTPYSYAKATLSYARIPCKEALFSCTKLGEYGRALAAEKQITFTPYGALVPNDASSLTQRIKEFTQEMKGQTM